MVEATCGLVVYGTPALPKALARLRGGHNTPAGTKGAAAAAAAHPKPTTGIKMSGAWKPSLRRDGNAARNNNNNKPESHRYLELRDYRHPSPPRSEDQEGMGMPNPAILRTTRVDVRTEEAGYHGAPGIGGASRQLPWT